jgi:hypothetical protein
MMWPRNRPKVWTWLAGASIFTLLLVGLAGCAEVEVVDTTPISETTSGFASPLPDEAGRHDLAILAVDFDPPLSYQELIVRRRSIALLVVIENRGTATERDVVVRAELTTPEDKELDLSRSSAVTSIAPGEIQIVRFDHLTKFPYHETYHLEVVVEPAPGEGNVGDNNKAFDIQIHRE